MPLNKEKARGYLKDFKFTDLFIDELGWNNYKSKVVVEAEGVEYDLEGIAEKRGMGAFRCLLPKNGKIPEYNTRKKIETKLAKSVFEHILIFVDNAQQKQIWQWAKREKGKPVAIREECLEKSQSGERLIQKLENLKFTLEQMEFEGVKRRKKLFGIQC